MERINKPTSQKVIHSREHRVNCIKGIYYYNGTSPVATKTTEEEPGQKNKCVTEGGILQKPLKNQNSGHCGKLRTTAPYIIILELQRYHQYSSPAGATPPFPHYSPILLPDMQALNPTD